MKEVEVTVSPSNQALWFTHCVQNKDFYGIIEVFGNEKLARLFGINPTHYYNDVVPLYVLELYFNTYFAAEVEIGFDGDEVCIDFSTFSSFDEENFTNFLTEDTSSLASLYEKSMSRCSTAH